MFSLALCVPALAGLAPLSAQPDLVGAWSLAPGQEIEVGGGWTLESTWMEFGETGSVFTSTTAGSGDNARSSSARGSYTLQADTLQIAMPFGEPAVSQVVVLGPDRVRIVALAGGPPVEFVRASPPVHALDLLGTWDITDGPGGHVVFDTTIFGAPVVRFRIGNPDDPEVYDQGTWQVSATDLTIQADDLGTLSYTSATRDGDSLILTGDGDLRLVLVPLGR